MIRPGFLSNIRSIDFNFFWCFVLNCNDATLVSLNQGSIVFFVLFSFRHYRVPIRVTLHHTHKYELDRRVLEVPARIITIYSSTLNVCYHYIAPYWSTSVTEPKYVRLTVNLHIFFIILLILLMTLSDILSYSSSGLKNCRIYNQQIPHHAIPVYLSCHFDTLRDL